MKCSSSILNYTKNVTICNTLQLPKEEYKYSEYYIEDIQYCNTQKTYIISNKNLENVKIILRPINILYFMNIRYESHGNNKCLNFLIVFINKLKS